MLTATQDAFGRAFRPADEVLKSLRQELTPGDMRLEAAIKALAYATGYKLKMQLAPYLYGHLSKPDAQMLQDTSSCPVHNMWAERTLGIVDALSRRSPNADITFLSAKTRCSQNKTLEWLLSKPKHEQQALLEFCIKEGHVCRQRMKEREAKYVRVQFARMRQKVHKKDVTAMNLLGKEIKEKLKDGGVIVHPALDDLEETQLDKLVSLFQKLDARSAGNVLIDHMWWDQTLEDNVTYRGKVMCLKTKKNGDISIKIAYWLPDEGEESMTYSNILFSSFIADMLMHDLMIL